MTVLRILTSAGLGGLVGLGAVGCMTAGSGQEDRPNERRIGPTGRVTMCHVPPADPASGATIEVEASEVGRHIALGDRVGPCTKELLACTALGGPCDDDDECCSQSCYRDRCNVVCRAAGENCDSPADCCADACANGRCRD